MTSLNTAIQTMASPTPLSRQLTSFFANLLSTKMLRMAVLPVQTEALMLHLVVVTAMRGSCALARGPTHASLHRAKNRRQAAESVLPRRRLPQHYRDDRLQPKLCGRSRTSWFPLEMPYPIPDRHPILRTLHVAKPLTRYHGLYHHEPRLNMRQAQAVFPSFLLSDPATTRIERARGAMAQRAKATATTLPRLNPLGLGQVGGDLRFVVEPVGPPTSSTSIPTARTRSKLRSKLTAKTALGAIHAEVGTTVRRSRMRTCTILPKAAKESRTRKTMATFARRRASAAECGPLSGRRFSGQLPDGRSARLMASPGHHKPEYQPQAGNAPASDASPPHHPLNIPVAKKGPPTSLRRSSRNGRLRMQFSNVRR
ncbi:hypothetical protein B0T16DRAFT_121258 [Cercophora newfieldiana]|uniref:Uncharacterized protein n=1 Tax=Cercophora newfieldiana TaxID=92897 RepID=A0AA40CTL1_9PEZI|nr:hypothetical protein B0T16DRAFT_121258 [Cercophora newfieldiana]